ncbi:MAG: hypothetical protein KGS48_16985 [Bacteroidetes bacterium]|nr:hypothetical protein [Bacteroidota bacterium]
MRLILLVFCTLYTLPNLHAQCSSMELGEFQNLQRKDASAKEAGILSLGFDLHSDFVLKGKSMRRFNKCWAGNPGKARYQQVLLWNTSADELLLLFSEETAYLALRQSIEGRHETANVQRGDQFYIGHTFRYQFSIQQLDGTPYYAVSIAFK